MMKPRRKDALTPKQRGYIGALSTRGHKRLTKMGAIDEQETPWRHREARDATKALDPNGVGWTISEAPARAFDDLETRFLLLAGEAKKAVDRSFGPSNDVRTITHEISVMMRTLAVGENYVAGICRRMFHGRPTWEGGREGQKVLAALNYELARRQKRAAQPLETSP